MRAIVYHGREDVRFEDLPEPSPKPGEVKLRVLYNGICGSDLHEYYHGPMVTRTTPHPLTGVQNPVVLGHDFRGAVVELGKGVHDLKAGDLVAVEPNPNLRALHMVPRGPYNHCPLGAIHGYNRDGGGLAEFTVIPRSMAHKLPAVSLPGTAPWSSRWRYRFTPLRGRKPDPDTRSWYMARDRLG